MASSLSSVPVADRPATDVAPPRNVCLALALVALIGGALLAVDTVQRFVRFGADTPYIAHLLALDAPMTSEVGEVLGPAGGQVDNLLFVVTLVWMAVAASLLLVAAAFWVSSARARHGEAARRVSAVGFWMGLALAVLAVVPLDGTWRDAGMGGAASGWSDDAALVLLLCVVGLLLLQVTSPRWRVMGGALRAGDRSPRQ